MPCFVDIQSDFTEIFAIGTTSLMGFVAPPGVSPVLCDSFLLKSLLRESRIKKNMIPNVKDHRDEKTFLLMHQHLNIITGQFLE